MGRILLVFVSILVSRLANSVDGLPDHLKPGCAGEHFNYTHGSAYEKNLNLLFTNFTSKSASVKFYNSTVGDGSNKVYGLFQCRFDIDLDVCNECVTGATKKITEVCPLIGKATIWYYECMLRYANVNIFSLSDTSRNSNRMSKVNVSDYAEFNPILANTMNLLINNASFASQRFASSITDTTLLFSGKLYSFAQCTPDLDSTDCNICLKRALSNMIQCCNRSVYVMVGLPSCQLRYDSTAPFLKSHLSQAAAANKKTAMDPAIIGAIIVGAFVVLLILSIVLGICLCCYCCGVGKETSSKVLLPGINYGSRSYHDIGLGNADFEKYDFDTLKNATNGFSAEVTLGKGGFGIVYKGTLENGDQIAIKRLSNDNSKLGTEQFMAEARLLVKLQHKNLVKLVGFCSQEDEKLLVYEFMSNASLDGFLFDPNKRTLLDWATRKKIVMGIARGLQYLHEDSRLTIIHRDLKPGNILLDNEMDPKIADFGTAKLFEKAQKFGSTGQIIGTPGYMAPEYRESGEYSDKSDVYSFGIMVLEIVSGQKNKTSTNWVQYDEDLSIRAWILWNEKQSFDITDSLLHNNCSRIEVMRCIQIGMLCVQAKAEQRPTMAAVVSMLTGSVELPVPSAPMVTFNH